MHKGGILGTLIPILLVLLSMFLGCFLAIQTGVNKELSTIVGAVIPAVGLSFLFGALTALVTVIIRGVAAKAGGGVIAEDAPKPKLWMYTGGFLGATALTTNVFVAPLLGFTLYGVMLVSGQLTSSFCIDHFGFAGLPVRKASVARMVFMAVTLAGCIVTNSATLFSSGSSSATSEEDMIQEGSEGGMLSGDSSSVSSSSSSVRGFVAEGGSEMLSYLAEGAIMMAVRAVSSSSSSDDLSMTTTTAAAASALGDGTTTAAISATTTAVAATTKAAPRELPIGPKIGLAIMGIIAGCLLPMQASINRRLSMRFKPHARSMAVVISFLSGSLMLLVIGGILYAIPVSQLPTEFAPKLPFDEAAASLHTAPWWAYTGGVLGGMFVTGAVLLSPVLGVSTFFVSTIAGFLTSSMTFDAIGAFGVEVVPVSLPRAIGVTITLLGAAGVSEEARITAFFKKRTSNDLRSMMFRSFKDEDGEGGGEEAALEAGPDNEDDEIGKGVEMVEVKQLRD